MPGIPFFALSKRHLEEDKLTTLNQLFRNVIDEINRLGGLNGRIALVPGSGLDMQGGTIIGLGDPADESEAVNLRQAMSLFGPAVMQKALDVSGTNVLRTVRRLNDPNQREKNSSFLNSLFSTPPNNNNATVSVAAGGGGTSIITVSAGTYFFADGSVEIFAQRVDTVANPGSGSVWYYYYLRLSDFTIQVDGPYTQDLVSNTVISNMDGNSYIGLAKVNAGGGGSGGGGGNGQGSGGCCEFDSILEFPEGSRPFINVASCDEWIEINLVEGQCVRVAPHTLVSVFKRAEDLKPEDMVETESALPVKVSKVEVVNRKSFKLVMRVVPGGTYLANGIRLHNAKFIR